MWHKLLEHQLAAATSPEGAVDQTRLLETISAAYHESDRERLRTDRSIRIMADELEELTNDLRKTIDERTEEASAIRQRFLDAVDNITQGIMLVDRNNTVISTNRIARTILCLTETDIAKGMTFYDVMQRLHAKGEFDHVPADISRQWLWLGIHKQPALYVRERPDGTHIEVRTTRLADGGAIRTYTDVTERQKREQALEAAEKEYRTLFENAAVGVYRTSLDGRQLRANPALYRMNGYESEAEMLAAIQDVGREWYVDPMRRTAFIQAMQTDGRVTDFVSEVYRHKTRERIWVSETAWTVFGPDGTPQCYEGMVVEATERILYEKRILELSLTDSLTRLPNRHAFVDTLKARLKGISPGATVAVHCLDLDRFKHVNDTQGHPAGDALLRHVATRLRKVCGPRRFVARLGGDEFAIIETEAAEAAASLSFAEKVIASLSRPYVIKGQRSVIGASVGIAFADCTLSDPVELMKQADIALYAAKTGGKQQARLFEDKMNMIAKRQNAVETALRQALSRGEIYPAYQPIFDTDSDTVHSYETLMRWHSAELGEVSPVEFIPIAEETGLIHTLGEWLLRTACQDAKHRLPAGRVAINVSAVQLRSPHFKAMVLHALAASGLEPRHLELEITENVLLADDPLTLNALEDLRKLGVRIALDDFGTGYSSLSYLQKFDFDKIKIDQSFVACAQKNAVNAAVVKAVIALTRDLGIDVVAEGVETPEQSQSLTRGGCRLQQGYLYGRPFRLTQTAVLPAQDVPYLASRRRLVAVAADPSDYTARGKTAVG